MTGTQYFANRFEHGRARKAKKQNMKQMMERRKTKKDLDEYQFSFPMPKNDVQTFALDSTHGNTSTNASLGSIGSSESKALVTIKPLKTSQDGGKTFANRIEHGLVRKMKKQNMREMVERRKARKEMNEQQLSMEIPTIDAGSKPCTNGCGHVGNAVTRGMCSKCHLNFLEAPTRAAVDKPCKNACGLSGNVATGGMCTKCHRKSHKEQPAPAVKAISFGSEVSVDSKVSNEAEDSGAIHFLNLMEYGNARQMKKQNLKKMKERKKLRGEMKKQQLSLQGLKSGIEEQSTSLQLLKDIMPVVGNAIVPAAQSNVLALTNGEQVSTSNESQAIVEVQKPKMTSSELATGMEQQTQLLQQILSKFNQIESKMDQMDSKIGQLTKNQDYMASSLKSLEGGIEEGSNKNLLSLTNSANAGILVEHGSSLFSASSQKTDAMPDFPKIMPNSMSQLLMEHEMLYKLNEYANPSTRKQWPAILKACYSKRKFMYSRIIARAKQMRGKSADFRTAKNKAAESFDMEMQERRFHNTDEYFKYLKNCDFARNN